MNPKPLQVSWAGPAVAGALLFSAVGVTPRPAAAAPAAPIAAVTAARVEVLCAKEAMAYISAWIKYLNAWSDYINTLPGGTEQEILDSAQRLDAAATEVGTTGFMLINCLSGYLGGGAGGYF